MNACMHQLLSRVRRLPAIAATKKALRAPFILRAVWREQIYRARAPHDLTVCAIFKDEANFLAEWISFHLGIGATHFFLYNNNSKDHYQDVLQPFIRAGLITLENWPAHPGQRSAYRDCLRHHWNVRWIAFIDIDEFLFSPRQVDIRPILATFSDLPAIFVHSITFGASGHQVPPTGSLFEAYVRCEPLAQSRSGKSIVNPRFVRNVSQSHVFPLWWGEARNTERVAIPTVPIPPDVDMTRAFATLQINHYWSRSIRDLADKVARGDAFYGGPRSFEQHLALEKEMNATTNTAIIPIARTIAAKN
jgi:hypothetical protein